MEQIRKGMKSVPFKLALAAGVLMTVPALEFNAEATKGKALYQTQVVQERLREAEIQLQVLDEILEAYPTNLTEEMKADLPFIIVEVSMRYGYDPLFIAGLIETESSFNNEAVSYVGARGLMQLLPYVGEALAQEVGLKWDGVETLHHPETNIELGVYYLRKLEDRFGDLDLALAAYNMGPTLLESKMARGFRPHGIYGGKVNAAYGDYQELIESRRSSQIAGRNL